MICRHRSASCLLASLLCGGMLSGARADHQPVLVIDGTTGAPLELREGDWGLYRPGAPPRDVYPIGPRFQLPPPRGYFPSAGEPPRVGRLERERPARRAMPRPDTSFYRTWSAASAPTPVDPQPRGEAPPITIAPSYGQSWPERPGAPRGINPAQPRW